MAKITKEKLKASLIGELEARGMDVLVYHDLVEDYAELWTVKERLIKDIDERGVTIEYQNGRNQMGRRQNDSIPNLIKTNAQMLKILSELGLRGADYEGTLDEEL
jgi:hypothetical protein